MAACLRRCGQGADARVVLEREVQLRERADGAADPGVADALARLGDALLSAAGGAEVEGAEQGLSDLALPHARLLEVRAAAAAAAAASLRPRAAHSPPTRRPRRTR